MTQSSHEIAEEILRRMELVQGLRARRRARTINAFAGFALALSAIGMFLIPRGMEPGLPIRAEASMLGGDPVAGLYILCGVIALTSGAAILIRLRRQRRDRLETKNKKQAGNLL